MRNSLGKFDLREEVYRLIIEGRVADFEKNYAGYLPKNVTRTFIEKDPSRNKNHKYLPWIGMVVGSEAREKEFEQRDADELIGMLGLFDRKVRGVDINSFKNVGSFLEYMEKVSGQRSKRKEIEDEGEELFNNERLRVTAPKTHRASMFYGGSTKWCISTSNSSFWNTYYNEQGNAIVFMYDRETMEKYAFTGEDSNSIRYATIYNDQDQTVSKGERDKLFELLEGQINEDGENALEKIEDYMAYDDGTERRENYINEKLRMEFEEGDGKATVEDYLTKAIEKHLNVEDLTDDWNKIVGKVFKEENNTYDGFLADIWYYTAAEHGNEDAGYFGSLEELKKILESYSERGVGNLEELLKVTESFYIFVNEIDDFVESELEVGAYEAFFEKWGKEYRDVLEEVAEYLDKVLNDPSQVLFPFGGKLKKTPKSFRELLKIMKKLGHYEMEKDLEKLTSGEARREKWLEENRII